MTSIMAAQALALARSASCRGAQIHIPSLQRICRSSVAVNDAPRWLSTDKITPMWDLAQGESVCIGDGSVPISHLHARSTGYVLRARGPTLTLKLDYRYNGIPLADDSSPLQIFMNNQYVGSVPLPSAWRQGGAGGEDRRAGPRRGYAAVF